MLLRLLRVQLRPYGKEITLVVLFQFVQTLATLYLPTLNADIIDDGVVKGDTGYIVRIGLVMLGVTLVQIACSIVAVYYGARTSMALGRDLRAAIFHRVQDFSAQEVNRFGAPSLITRTTNDVQQVQLLVLMTFTMMVAAPIMCVGGIVLALRQDAALSSLLLVVLPVMVVIVGADRDADAPAVPHDAGAHRPDQPGAARADHRHPGDQGLRPRPARAGALRRGQRRS